MPVCVPNAHVSVPDVHVYFLNVHFSVRDVHFSFQDAHFYFLNMHFSVPNEHVYSHYVVKSGHIASFTGHYVMLRDLDALFTGHYLSDGSRMYTTQATKKLDRVLERIRIPRRLCSEEFQLCSYCVCTN